MLKPFLKWWRKGIRKDSASSACKYYHVFENLLLSYWLTLAISDAQKVDESLDVATFGRSTGTSNLRKHLITKHLDVWAKACAGQQIPMTTAALQAIAGIQGQEIGEDAHHKYSKEAFADALAEFIVGDDLVSNDNIIGFHF